MSFIPTPADEVARYMGEGLPEHLTLISTEEGVVMFADYPFDEALVYAELERLGVEITGAQYSPCG